MTIQQIVFYFFSTLIIASSCMVIVAKNSVRAVLFLIFTFFCMAGLWMLLESEFLAIALVLVYVGAVMVLFLFVVMMLDIEAPKLKEPFVRYWPLGLLVAGLMLGMMILTVDQNTFGLALSKEPPPAAIDASNVKALGTLLYSEYLLAFEIAGVILLVAMIAAIGLAFRGPREVRSQKPAMQAQVQKQARLRIIKMRSEGESP